MMTMKGIVTIILVVTEFLLIETHPTIIGLLSQMEEVVAAEIPGEEVEDTAPMEEVITPSKVTYPMGIL